MKPYVVLIPGLRREPNNSVLRLFTRLFSGMQNKVMYGIMRFWWFVQGEIYLLDWLAPQESFDTELQALNERVEQIIAQGYRVVLVGSSAGTSAAINLFAMRSDIAGVINIDGRVREGSHSGRRSLESAAKHNPIFKVSVLRCEEALEGLGSDRLARILTIVPLVDEIVPADTAIINGAKNIKVWSTGHIPSICFATVVRR